MVRETLITGNRIFCCSLYNKVLHLPFDIKRDKIVPIHIIMSVQKIHFTSLLKTECHSTANLTNECLEVGKWLNSFQMEIEMEATQPHTFSYKFKKK